MKVAKRYSFNNGLETIGKDRPEELAEVFDAIGRVNPKTCETKVDGLYSPKLVAAKIMANLEGIGWSKPKTRFDGTEYDILGDGLKNGVGVEIQFGPYAFLGWDSMRKMVAFAKNGVYQFGIEVTPVARLRQRMSKGVGSYEQVIDRLQKNPNPELKIPVIILGIDA